MSTEEDRQIVHDVIKAVQNLNDELDKASAVGIKINLISSSSIGKLNDMLMCGEAVRVIKERIAP